MQYHSFFKSASSIPVAPRTSSAPPSKGLSIEEKRAMFEEAERADADFENAKQVADQMLQARSAVIENIFQLCGAGPFIYKGESVRIIKRRSDNGNRIIYFFRAISNKDPEEI